MADGSRSRARWGAWGRVAREALATQRRVLLRAWRAAPIRTQRIFDSLDAMLAREARRTARSHDATRQLRDLARGRRARRCDRRRRERLERRTSATALDALARERGVGALIVPNFSIGATLMMRFAEEAARYFPDAEIVELHHAGKERQAVGHGARNRRRASSAQRRGRRAIHSVRLPGLLAHQEVLFGGTGELLTIRHDSLSRESFVAGMLAAVRAVVHLRGLAIGLDAILEAVSFVNVAVVGATGAVGETIVRVLEERNVPVAAAAAVCVARSGATASVFAATRSTCAPRRTTRCAVSTSCSLPAARTRAKSMRPALLERGSIVIDNSSTFRMRSGVPLIVPEVNAEAMRRRASALSGRELHGDRAVHRAARRFATPPGCAACASRRIRRRAAPGAPGSTSCSPDERAVVRGEPEPAAGGLSARRSRATSFRRSARSTTTAGAARSARLRDETRKMLDLPGSARQRDGRARAGAHGAQRSGLLRNASARRARRSSRAALRRGAGIVFHAKAS